MIIGGAILVTFGAILGDIGECGNVLNYTVIVFTGHSKTMMPLMAGYINKGTNRNRRNDKENNMVMRAVSILAKLGTAEVTDGILGFNTEITMKMSTDKFQIVLDIVMSVTTFTSRKTVNRTLTIGKGEEVSETTFGNAIEILEVHTNEEAVTARIKAFLTMATGNFKYITVTNCVLELLGIENMERRKTHIR